MVRLEEVPVIYGERDEAYFNSSMVRLEVDTPNAINIAFIKFQFQYGTIRS